MAAARHRILPVLIGSILALFATGAGASTIQLSQFSSETDPGPGVLKATLSIAVTGSQLTLTLSNDTMAPDEYTINGV